MNNIIQYKFLLCFAICLNLLLTQAYSITGIVLDYELEKPIINANVYIENSQVRTTTDNQGNFILYLNNEFNSSANLNINVTVPRLR